jgi:hypothetical protein
VEANLDVAKASRCSVRRGIDGAAHEETALLGLISNARKKERRLFSSGHLRRSLRRRRFRML